MSTTSTTAAACPARLTSSPKRLISRLRHEERGVLDIELIGFVPILVLVTLFLVQGFFAVSSDLRQCSRPRRRSRSNAGALPRAGRA